MIAPLDYVRNVKFAILAIAASVSLAGCDALMQKAGKSEIETPVEATVVEPMASKAASLSWEWTTSDRLNWTKSHIQNTLQFPADGGVRVIGPDAPTRPDMYLKSPLLEVNGSDYPTVKIDIACVANCGVAETDPAPRIYYITDNHEAGVQFSANATDPTVFMEGQRRVLTFDMTTLTRGGSDWVDSKINHIRIELPEVNNSDFIIHSVKLCAKDDVC